MKKFLLVALAGVIGLAGCQKENGEEKATGGENKGLITSVTAGMAPSTRVNLETDVYSEAAGKNVDRVTWKEGDLIYFWELSYITNITNTAGTDAEGYMLKDGSKVIFKLASGAGTKTGVFVPQTEGEGIDPVKSYVAIHCPTPSHLTYNNTTVVNGDVGMRNILMINSPTAGTMNSADHDIVTGRLVFTSPVGFEGSDMFPLEFKPLTTIMEYRLYQSSELAGDYTISDLGFSTSPRYLNLAAAGYNFDSGMSPNLRHASGTGTYGYKLTTSDIALSKDPENPTILRYPILMRLTTGTGNYDGGGTFNITYTLNLKDSGGATVTKTFNVTKTADAGKLAFPTGTTHVKTFVVE